VNAELERAARAASEATGLDVRTVTLAGNVYVEVYAHGPDGLGAPLHVAILSRKSAALAYLEGLTQGAHISNVRHANAIDHFRMLLNLYNPARGSVGRDILCQARAALAELGTTTQAREES